MIIHKGKEVMEALRPNKEWAITGEDFNSIQYFNGCKPITKAEFELEIAQYDARKAEQAEAKAAQKAALLDRLGITEDEAKLLLA
jgi:hypothetical protein